jgi:hypothetical protein
MTRDDLAAIYAFLRTQKPASTGWSSVMSWLQRESQLGQPPAISSQLFSSQLSG